jgi:hypothetical protein
MSEQLESLLEVPRELKLTDGSTVTIRPFTFGSFGLCKKLGLTMFSGEMEAEEDGTSRMDNSAAVDQIGTFFWMQSQPVNEVLAAVRAGTWEDAALEFEMKLPISAMDELMKEIERTSGMVREAAVDVLPKGDDDGDKDAPGN